MDSKQPKATKTTFVYDTRTGKVVHVHQFVPYDRDGAMSDREMEEMALKLAPPVFDRARLGVLHQGRDLELSPAKHYRVDVKNRRLLVEAAPTKPVQGVARKAPATRKAAAKPAAKKAPAKTARATTKRTPKKR